MKSWIRRRHQVHSNWNLMRVCARVCVCITWFTSSMNYEYSLFSEPASWNSRRLFIVSICFLFILFFNSIEQKIPWVECLEGFSVTHTLPKRKRNRQRRPKKQTEKQRKQQMNEKSLEGSINLSVHVFIDVPDFRVTYFLVRMLCCFFFHMLPSELRFFGSVSAQENNWQERNTVKETYTCPLK